MCRELLHSDIGQRTVDRLMESGVATLELGRTAYQSISEKDNPQGLGVVAVRRLASLATIDLRSGVVWIALEGPQDPGNVGSIMRTVEATGAAGIILLGSSVDPYDPRAVRASMGSIFNVGLVAATLEEFITWKQTSGRAVIGVTGAGRNHYRRFEYPQGSILLLGSEREGISSEILSACTDTVSLPMTGRADSLNLSVAAGVLLYELFEKQSGSSSGSPAPMGHEATN